ncbi:GntR family transcriptional regulator [Arenibacterium sp. CAU 1754]
MAEQNLPEQIAQQLRRDILQGKLQPGASIKERDNASDLGVSRTPMREAIRILAKEGLVQLRPARSPIVAQPSLAEVSNSIDVLSALEMLSGKLACLRASDKEIAEIRKSERYLAENYDKLDDVERFEADMNFHIAIAKASHNEALAETHMSYLARLWRARFLSAMKKRSRDRVLRQHEAIIRSIEARDVAATQAALDDHLEHLLINVEEFFESEDKAEVTSG